MEGVAALPRSRNISVAIRVRPLVESERRHSTSNVLAAWDVVDVEPGSLMDRKTGEVWHFDQVFGPGTSTEELFEVSVRDVVDSFCEGVNGTVFAYGQTASGKTFTMQGNGSKPGVMQLAVHEIFEQIRLQRERTYMMHVSYLEIYNEQVFDLLSEDVAEVRVLDDHQGHSELRNLTRRPVTSGPEDIIGCLAEGDHHRHKGETKMNEHSSRSHAILMIDMECRFPHGAHGNYAVTKSTLSLVDLAGSEGLRNTEATGERRREGKNINRSLLALSQVINSLADQTRSSKASHISFRDSKLTRILQRSIGGNAQTAIICAVSPAPFNYAETRRTLDFASRAKCVRTRVATNLWTEGSQGHIRQLRGEIEALQAELGAKGVEDFVEPSPARGCSVDSLPSASKVRAEQLQEEAQRLRLAYEEAKARADAAEEQLQAAEERRQRKMRGAKGASATGIIAGIASPQKRGRDLCASSGYCRFRSGSPHHRKASPAGYAEEEQALFKRRRNFQQWQESLALGDAEYLSGERRQTSEPSRRGRHAVAAESTPPPRRRSHSASRRHGRAHASQQGSATGSFDPSTLALASELLRRLSGPGDSKPCGPGMADGASQSDQKLDAMLAEAKQRATTAIEQSGDAALVPAPSGPALALGPPSSEPARDAASSSRRSVQPTPMLALPAPPPPSSPTPQPVSPPVRRRRRRLAEESAEETAKAAKAARADAEARQSRIRELQQELERKRRDLEATKAARVEAMPAASRTAPPRAEEASANRPEDDGMSAEEAEASDSQVQDDLRARLVKEKEALLERLEKKREAASTRKTPSSRSSEVQPSEGEAALAELRETLRRRAEEVEAARKQLQEKSTKVATRKSLQSGRRGLGGSSSLPRGGKPALEESEDVEEDESEELTPGDASMRLRSAEFEADEVLTRPPVASASAVSDRARPARAHKAEPAGDRQFEDDDDEEFGMSAAEFRALTACLSKKEERLREARARRPVAEAAAREAEDKLRRMQEAAAGETHISHSERRRNHKAEARSASPDESAERRGLEAEIARQAEELSRTQAQLAEADQALVRERAELRAEQAERDCREQRAKAKPAAADSDEESLSRHTGAQELERKLGASTHPASRAAPALRSSQPATMRPAVRTSTGGALSKRLGSYSNLNAASRLRPGAAQASRRLSRAGGQDSEGCKQM
eukprot:TRINITY_DN79062_c0_g1_i1.p1 TRINITY_DN79062_c0_g1~~TRINITY_DN79062_c0_g1_i1.p1  ORF type:complete len:1191 (+),score=283.38 TRINITY_DN79062_c0_g1_i1:86-3658(+)